MPIFVRLVTVDIHPAKNAERPAIEGTTRSCQCPKYEVPLLEAVWGKIHAQSVIVRPMVERVNPLYELLPRDGKDPLVAEEIRLTNKYPKAFSKVYREGELAKEIMVCAESANVYLDQAQALEDKRANEASEKAAAALIKEATKSVVEGQLRAEKRRPGRPRAVINPEPASADA